MLVLRERLDTNPARSQEHSMSVSSGDEGGPVAMELEVENTAPVAIQGVTVTRPLPDELTFENTGVATVEGNELTWNVGDLAAGEKQVLSIEGTIVVSGTKAIDAGAASATYTSDSTLSNLNFRELDAFCRGFSYMRVREDERPDNWLCRTTFENRSSFAVDLVKLQVRMKGSEDLLFDIGDVRQDVKPLMVSGKATSAPSWRSRSLISPQTSPTPFFLAPHEVPKVQSRCNLRSSKS